MGTGAKNRGAGRSLRCKHLPSGVSSARGSPCASVPYAFLRRRSAAGCALAWPGVMGATAQAPTLEHGLAERRRREETATRNQAPQSGTLACCAGGGR